MVLIHSVIFYLLPQIIFIALSAITGQHTIADFLTLKSFIFQIFILIFPFLYHNIFNKKIFECNDAEKSSKLLKKYIIIQILTNITYNFLFVFFVFCPNFLKVDIVTRNHYFLSLFLILGCTFNYALLPYIKFMQEMEKSMKNIELKKGFTSMSITVRGMLVTFFSSFGCAMVVASISQTGGARNAGFVYIMALIGPTIAVLENFLQMSSTSDRLKQIDDFAQEMENKDFSKEPLVRLSRDEFGLLINKLNSAQLSVKEAISKSLDSSVITKINIDNVSDNSKTSLELSKNTMSKAISSMDIVNNQISSVEEATASALQITTSIENLNNLITVQASNVTESSAAIEQMVANINSVSNNLNKNSVLVDSLKEITENGVNLVEKSYEKINDILDKSSSLLEASKIILNISSQTNLLAMNAAIEAAHAGSAGAGFAVVADEIRKLADMSGEQGNVISKSLKTFQEEIVVLSNEFNKTKENFNKTKEITTYVAEQEQTIKYAMNEQTTGAGQILIAIEDVNDITVKVRDLSNEIKSGSFQISKEMENVTTISKDTRNAFISINDNIKNVKENLEKVDELTKDVEKMSAETVTILNEFKV